MTCYQLFAAAVAGASVVLGAQAPDAREDVHRRVFPLGDFRLESGVVLPGAQIAYATFGTLNADGRAHALIVIPPAVPGITGVVAHHAYGVLDLSNNLVFASEASRLEIIP